MSSDPHRQFDFWLGVWEVRDPEGRVVGRNRIERLFGPIGVQEHWDGLSGLRGASYSVYAHGRWHQTWVDSSGTLLLLDGGVRDGAMVLEGTAPSADAPAGTVRHRITWSATDAGRRRVRQLWEVSPEDREAWEVAFDGRYEPIG